MTPNAAWTRILKEGAILEKSFRSIVYVSTSKGFVVVLIVFSLFQLYISEHEIRRLRETNNRMVEHMALAKRLQRLRQFQTDGSNLRKRNFPLPENYCVWRPRESSCIDILFDRIFRSPGNASTASYNTKRWAFFGDSTMKIMVRQNSLSQMNQMAQDLCHCQKKTAPRCHMYDVFQLIKKESNWTRPIHGFEGPVDYGLHNPHCQDCFGCSSVFMECQGSTACNYTTVSFFGVEFARDVTMQTSNTTTTQGAIASYLHNQECLSDPFVCVVSTGLHDMAIPGISDVRFLNNVAWYLSKLRPCCRHVIWIQLTSVIDLPWFPQHNARIERWNELVKSMFQDDTFISWTTVLDTYDVSKMWPHFDNVHLLENYYVELAAFFSHIINKSVFDPTFLLQQDTIKR